ncbi:MAG: hypothetical protein AAF480_20320 [Actinomycetota bacterium]
MAAAVLDRPNGCLPPIRVDRVVADPAVIRTMAREHGPYFMPARYLINAGAANDAKGGSEDVEVPAHLIGPVWRGDWAIDGRPLVDGAEELLTLAPFVDGAREMCGAESIVDPQQVFINLTTPMRGSGFAHVDIPEFVGRDRANAPGWLLQAMGSSRAFEDVRITIVTAVSWFHTGERGFFRYWPEGIERQSVRHEDMWNTAVVGDNDFMFHKVERVGRDDQAAVQGLTIDSTLRHDGDAWRVTESGSSLASYADEDVRISLSWKARVYPSAREKAVAEAGDDALSDAAILERFAEALGEPLAAADLTSPALRDQLQARFPGYAAG